MAATEAREEPLQELDVRPLRKPDKHPAIFATYAELPAGGSFVLINDHDPKHLRDEFEADHPGSYRWEYLQRERGDWRIRITKLASTPLPRVLVNTAAAEAADPGAQRGGTAVGRCHTSRRHGCNGRIGRARDRRRACRHRPVLGWSPGTERGSRHRAGDARQC